MKRLIFFGMILFLSASLFAVTAEIQELKGNVKIKNPGADWVSADIGMILEQDSLISTGFKSTAVIAVGDSILTVQPLTRLSFAELSEADRPMHLLLHSGRVRAEVNRPREKQIDFTIRSPSVIASVRGTIFDITIAGIEVIRGRVLFTDTDGVSVSVGQGSFSSVDTDQLKR